MLLFTFVLISPIISAKVVAVEEILTEIIAISIDDGVQFQIKGASDIMEEMEYSETLAGSASGQFGNAVKAGYFHRRRDNIAGNPVSISAHV